MRFELPWRQRPTIQGPVGRRVSLAQDQRGYVDVEWVGSDEIHLRSADLGDTWEEGSGVDMRGATAFLAHLISHEFSGPTALRDLRAYAQLRRCPLAPYRWRPTSGPARRFGLGSPRPWGELIVRKNDTLIRVEDPAGDGRVSCWSVEDPVKLLLALLRDLFGGEENAFEAMRQAARRAGLACRARWRGY